MYIYCEVTLTATSLGLSSRLHHTTLQPLPRQRQYATATKPGPNNPAGLLPPPPFADIFAGEERPHRYSHPLLFPVCCAKPSFQTNLNLFGDLVLFNF
jgi:hypothetical protein